MIARDPMKGTIAHWNRGDLPFGLRLVSVCLAVTWMAGCQGPGSTAKTPAAEQDPGAAGLAAPKATDDAKPATVGAQIKIVKPAGIKVSGGTPKITVEKDVIDLGEIGVETKHSGQFKFTNTGDAPLKIELVRSCCGVVTKGVEAGQEYAPGQSGALEFEYQGLAMPNPIFSRLLYLQTNDPERSLTTLTIKAAVVRRVDYKPEKLRLLLKGTNAGCPEITLVSLDGRPFSITDFRSTASTIKAEFDPGAKATQFVLRPTVDMAKLEHNMRGQISIDVTHPDCSNVMLPYDTLPEFEVNTSTIMVFGLRAGQAVQREIWILSNYQDDFEIESVSSPKRVIKLVEETKVDNRYQLRIEITPPVRGRDETVLSDTLQIKIKNAKTVSIPFRGFYQEMSDFNVSR